MNRETFLKDSTRVALPVIIAFKGKKYPSGDSDNEALAELSFEEETIEITLFADKDQSTRQEVFIWTYSDIERIKFFNMVEDFEEKKKTPELSEDLGLKVLFKNGVTYLLACKDANVAPFLAEFLPERGVQVANDLA
ncbi:hypothetical protein OZX60_00455 [Streptococcaceae bacterium ESL0687]|nr:hypothetical protein OZX60_00455 [Streptococcaceae bacterium ESL0687]